MGKLPDATHQQLMDIRIPPGRDRYWSQKYERAGSDKASAQLGLDLLTRLLHGSDKQPPTWVRPEKFAVFSIGNTARLRGATSRVC